MFPRLLPSKVVYNGSKAPSAKFKGQPAGLSNRTRMGVPLGSHWVQSLGYEHASLLVRISLIINSIS